MRSVVDRQVGCDVEFCRFPRVAFQQTAQSLFASDIGQPNRIGGVPIGAFAGVRSNGLNYSEIHAGCEKGKHPQWSSSKGVLKSDFQDCTLSR